MEKKTDSHRRLVACPVLFSIYLIDFDAMFLRLIVYLSLFIRNIDPRGERESRQTIQVTKQGIWFILAYMAAWWPPIIALIMYEKTPPEYVCFISAMYPLQGAFNALVYFRPKYIAEQQRMMSTSDSHGRRLSVLLDTVNLPRMSSDNLNGIVLKTPLKLGRYRESPPLESNEPDTKVIDNDVDIENGGDERNEKEDFKTLPIIEENS